MLPRPRSIVRAVALTALLPSAFPSPCRADDWPQWLGPDRNGVWKETGILTEMPKDGPKVLWRKPIEGGYSGPAVANGRVYVTDRGVREPDPGLPKGAIPGTERIHCLDATTGERIWLHEYPRIYSRVDRPMGPRTTPVVVGDRVYSLGTMGDLICLNAADGKPIWSKLFVTDFQTRPPVWGYSAHLLVHGGLVYAFVGGKDHAVVAFDAATGEVKWHALTTADVGYSAPVIATLGGKDQLIVWLSDLFAGLDPKTGAVIWQHAHPEKGKKQMTPAVSIVTPKVVGEQALVSSAYDGPLMVEFAKGSAEATIAWRAKDTYPKPPEKLAVLMTSIIAKGDHLYGVSADTGEVVCTARKTGDEVWRDKGLFGGKDALFGSAFWVENGELVYCFTDAGDLVILKLSPEKYVEVGRAHILDPIGADRGRKVIWAHPAFANKRIIARNEKEIVCWSLAK